MRDILTDTRAQGLRFYIAAFALLLPLFTFTGCSIRSLAINAMADSMAKSSVVYARDGDPELVGDALPFMLKTVEGLLEESPEHEELLLTACKGFTSYAQAFLAEPADRLEETDLSGARHQRDRASKLFVRAQGYGLRALELAHTGIVENLAKDPINALKDTGPEDVPVLFWTGAAWAGAISNAKGDMDLVADLNIANALLQRANSLDESWNDGAIHDVLISLETARSGDHGGSIEGARRHFHRAQELSQGKRLGPLVTFAETVVIKEQLDRPPGDAVDEFRRLLMEALAIDLELAPDDRLANTLARRKAQWLLDHTADFFIDFEEEEIDP